jgi:hypothetical protein
VARTAAPHARRWPLVLLGSGPTWTRSIG